MDRLYIAAGIIKVEARGYWFTYGGEKGSFGYYPHLKDKDMFPVFPDTQIKGDLRMAANWFKELGGNVEERLIEEVFGRRSGELSSSLHITDLELTEESKNEWGKKGRFQVKPRIAVDDECRAVQKEKHMLVDREFSYLEGLSLQSKIYLGYFDSRDELDKAKTLIEEAVKLLSGFGAFRSRGYGRGKVEVEWEQDEIVEYKENTAAEDNFLYFLKALTNFRNKPIEPGVSRQGLGTLKYIPSHQLRGWFIRTYNRFFGKWPSLDDLKTILFPDCYPSINRVGKQMLGYPPPMTTFKNENKEIRDVFGFREIGKLYKENFFNTKTKPLSSDMFVTDSDKPSIIEIQTRERIRNALNEDFLTEEDNLFVQELIEKDTVFGGRLRMNGQNPKFKKEALFILQNIKPVINGTIFEPVVEPYNTAENTTNYRKKVFLVTSPILYKENFFNDDNRIFLSTLRRYNVTLRRPRRNRIVIDKGSVLRNKNKICEGLLEWKGFGKKIIWEKTEDSKLSTGMNKAGSINNEKIDLTEEEKEEYKKITRSQAGLLKELLHPLRKPSDIKNAIKDRLKKYEVQENREGYIPKRLYEKILEFIEANQKDEMRRYVNSVLEFLYLEWWNKKKKPTEEIEKLYKETL